MQNMTYSQQLSFKTSKCIKLLGSFCHVEDIIGMDRPLHYRNKVQAAFGTTRDKKIISGVYQSSSHKIVCVDNCMLENETADRIIVTVRNLLPRFKLTAYNEDNDRGFLRHVLVRIGYKTGQVMVVLVTASSLFPKKTQFVNELLRRHAEITTVVQNVNPTRTSLVLGQRDIVIYGKGYIEDELCGKRFRLSPQSFYQINPVQTEVLYQKAIEFATLTGNETVIDAYCGIGTIGLSAYDKVKRLVGVEQNPSAIRDAKINAKLNKAKNVDYFCADAGQFMVNVAKENEKVDVVFVDPPRAGCDKAFLKSLVTLSPKKVIYISCCPETLARDLAFLCKNGYKARKIQPVDMFPHTEHVETVVQLVRKKPDTHIDFEIDLDEFDLTSAESKATYQEIKDYVFDKFGLKVSSFYISQVKAKCGIIERENYNKPKSENTKQPKCPKEKEEAIMDALRHFKMI